MAVLSLCGLVVLCHNKQAFYLTFHAFGFCFRTIAVVLVSGLFFCFLSVSNKGLTELRGAGIAQWLERRTRDRKVAGSNPSWSGGRIFFSWVSFLC